jgi:hypothetical protein
MPDEFDRRGGWKLRAPRGRLFSVGAMSNSGPLGASPMWRGRGGIEERIVFAKYQMEPAVS